MSNTDSVRSEILMLYHFRADWSPLCIITRTCYVPFSNQWPFGIFLHHFSVKLG